MQPQKAIVPGIVLGSLILILTARLLTSTQPAAAATQQPQNSPQEDSSCSLTSLPEPIQPWCGLIEATSANYGVDPELVAAVMMQESGGQSDIISSSGAVGLMQVMPSDGIAAGFMCVNGPCFASRPSTQQLLDPEFNIDYGVRMLAGLLERYGNERDALKAYGPYNVEYYYADKVLAIKGNL
jgi:soluble lytic murein transglycosylase-like protein